MIEIGSEIRRWNSGLDAVDLDSLKELKFVAFRSSSTTKTYPGGYWYREAVRLGKLENGQEIIITVHEYHAGATEVNAWQTKEWRELKKQLKDKKLRDILD